MGKQRKWDEMFGEASERMEQWRRENRKVSLRAIEKEVDGELARVRAQMIQDLALESEMADIGGRRGSNAQNAGRLSKPMDKRDGAW